VPNIKSAKKRVKVIAKKTAQNKTIKTALKTAVKKAYIAVDTNSDDKAQAVSLAFKKIDQAVAKGILHKNTGARGKSSLAKRLNASA
jgi:small subunit ribosomal protein S20